MASDGQKIRDARERRGLSQRELAEAVGTRQQTVEKIEKDQIKFSRFKQKIFSHLSLHSGSDATTSGRVLPYHAGRTAQDPLLGERDLPVYASAEGGTGSMVVSTDPIDFVVRPQPLARVKDGYGLLISGVSMEPAFEAGDTALVHPHLPPLADTDVVIYAENQGDIKASVKRLVRATETHWVVRQWNPPREYKLARAEWQKAHRIVGKFSRR